MGPSLAEEQRRRRQLRRGTAMVALALTAAAGLVVLLIWLGSGSEARPAAPQPMVKGPVHTGRPEPMAVASAEGVRLQLPIARKAVTAIGYLAVGDRDVLPLEPEGTRANLSFLQRSFRQFLATERPSKLRYYVLDEAAKPKAVAVGAFPGTSVYAPISGTVLAVTQYMLDDEAAGSVVQLQPLGDSETVVVLRNIDVDEKLAVGQTVSEGATLLGSVRDLSELREQPLARHTHDSGSGVEMFIRRVQPEMPS